MTTFYICAAIGWIVTCAVAYALGWCEGKKQGELDGLQQAAAECRRRCGMSADEIKALAQQAFVDGMANHHAGLLKTEARCKQYAAALLAHGAEVMLETIKAVMKTETDPIVLHRLAEVAAECAWCEREYGKEER